jgi:hypothetical protein
MDINFYIDAIAATKRSSTNAAIKDASLNAAAHRWIDAQTQFAKMLVSNTEAAIAFTLESAAKR